MSTKYQPPQVREPIAQKIKQLDKSLANPMFPVNDAAGYAEAKAQREATQAHLDRVTPPVPDGTKRAQLKARQALLENAMIHGDGKIPPMCSRRQMQDNPTGSTMQNLGGQAWLTHNVDSTGKVVKADQGAAFEWKDNQYQLHAEAGAEAIEAGVIGTIRPDVAVPLADNRAPVSYAPGANLTLAQMEVLAENFPDSEWPAKVKFERLVQGATVPAPDAVVAKPDSLKPSAPRCQATTARGTQCKRDAEPNGYCKNAAHQKRASE